MTRIWLAGPVLALSVFVLGCVEYQQRVTLRADGSGTVDISVEAPRDVNLEGGGLELPRGDEDEVCAELHERYDGPHVHVKACEVRTVGNRRRTEFTLVFDNLEALSDLDLLAGRSEFHVRRNGGIEVRRTIELEGDPDWSETRTRFEEWIKERLSEDVFSRIRFRYEIAFPKQVEETNADWVRGGRIAVWRYTLRDLIGRDRVVQYAKGK